MGREGKGWAGGLCFRGKYFFRVRPCWWLGAFLYHMGITRVGGLAVILHLFSIAAGSAEICIGIKDGKGQIIYFLACSLPGQIFKAKSQFRIF